MINPEKEFKVVTDELYSYVVLRDCGICQKCGKKGEQLHHVIFRSQMGKNKANNLILLCFDCHIGSNGIHCGGENLWKNFLERIRRNEIRLRKTSLRG